MKREDYAVECFESGFNCAQSVFTAFSTAFGMNIKQALRVAGSFGGGIGHIGEACGN